MSVVDGWAEKFGDKFKPEQNAPRAGKYDYELNVAHPVRVEAAKIIETKRKEICLQLDLAILEGDEVVGNSREWFTLPKQVTDGDKAKGDVIKITYRRRDDIQRILASTENSAHAKYARREERDGKFVYFDAENKEMTNEDFRERETLINTRVMDTCDQWHEQIGDTVEAMHGASFFIVKAPNPRNAQYPYTNVYTHKPDTIRLLGEESETPF